MTTQISVMGEAAQEYARRGDAVVPVWHAEGDRCGCRAFDCQSPGKHPIGSCAPNGLKDATTDEPTITKWWALFPKANIATRTGDTRTVLDIDAGKGGFETLARLEAQHGPLPTTAKVLSGGGGAHYHFRPVPGLRNSSSKIGLGIDVRGEDGYVLLPPSNHVSGGTYLDDLMAPMYETPLAPMPRWLIALAQASSNRNGHHHHEPEEWAVKLMGAPEGQRRAVACEIAGHYLGLRIVAAEVEAILIGYADRCTPPFPEREVRELVRDLARRDRTRPRAVATTAASVTRAAVIVTASTITPESMNWLWPGRLAVGALTNTVGLPDQGKSLLFTDITARLTTGAPMPPAPRRTGHELAKRVLILTLEDSLSHTMVPRLIKAGANLELVDFVQMVRNTDGRTSLLTLAEDLDVLAATLSAQPYGLLVVDGITGYLGDAKTHNDAEVRRVLSPFTALLDRARVAGLSVMHPPKSITTLAYYAGGSVAFSSIPRVTLGVGPDPQDAAENPRRLLMKLKGNLYGAVPTLAYRIVADGPADVPRLQWDLDPVTVSIADVLDPPKEAPEDRGTRRACEEWLRAYLADGRRPSLDAERAARDAGFKPRTIDRAKANVVDSVKQGRGGWDWVLR